MTSDKHIENLNGYIEKYPSPLPFTQASLDLFKRDPLALDAAMDYLIALFSKIGLGEGFAPTVDGIILDSCLEFLAELKEEYHS